MFFRLMELMSGWLKFNNWWHLQINLNIVSIQPKPWFTYIVVCCSKLTQTSSRKFPVCLLACFKVCLLACFICINTECYNHRRHYLHFSGQILFYFFINLCSLIIWVIQSFSTQWYFVNKRKPNYTHRPIANLILWGFCIERSEMEIWVCISPSLLLWTKTYKMRFTNIWVIAFKNGNPHLTSFSCLWGFS